VLWGHIIWTHLHSEMCTLNAMTAFCLAAYLLQIIKIMSITDPEAMFQIYDDINSGGVSCSEQQTRKCVAAHTSLALMHAWPPRGTGQATPPGCSWTCSLFCSRLHFCGFSARSLHYI
jgi:hypothetical protein